MHIFTVKYNKLCNRLIALRFSVILDTTVAHFRDARPSQLLLNVGTEETKSAVE